MMREKNGVVCDEQKRIGVLSLDSTHCVIADDHSQSSDSIFFSRKSTSITALLQ
jgi:hypothetical protein